MKKEIFLLCFFIDALLLKSCSGCSSNSSNDTSYLDATSVTFDDTESYTTFDNSINVPYTEMYGNTITVPVKINGLSLDMIFDTGASSTCITLAEAQYLYDKGELTENDVLDLQQFQTADGKISVGLKVILRNVSIGDEINLHDIEALVVQNQEAPLLLGQSVMKQFREISVDRANGVIKFFE